MSNISIKVNLRQLKNTVKSFKKQDGSLVDCLVIPVKDNHLFEGEKGIYLDLSAFEIKNKVGESKDTHLIKQSLPKEVYGVMTDDQKKELPILGNAIVWGSREADTVEAGIVSSEEETDDLPF